MKQARYIPAAIMIVAALLTGQVSAQTVDTDIRVSLTFDDTPITTVLKMLANQNDLNLVVSADVSGNISIDISDVSLAAALDAILLPNGYNYYYNEGVIIVKPADNWVAGELEAHTYRLKYITADAAKAALEPLLSAKGKIVPIGKTANERSDQTRQPTDLVVFDYPAVHLTIADLIDEIDYKKRQISVEAKIIETNLNQDEKLGINWPKTISASIGGVPTPGGESETGSTGGSQAAVMPLEDGNWQLGYLSVSEVDLVLDYLRQRNNAKLLSNPRLTTMDNETATIDIQTIIPIQTVNRFSEGAVVQDIVTFQDEEIGISLEVTPRINDDSTITMRVKPVVEEIIGYTGPSDNQKPITSQRTITTMVTVRNNETIAIGGLLKETQIENEESIFLLGQIPILGALFTHTSTETKTTDLLILLTPRILE